jgi:hypothetical protein
MDGMWCFVVRTVARSVVAAGSHGGEKKKEKKEKAGCRKTEQEKLILCQF